MEPRGQGRGRRDRVDEEILQRLSRHFWAGHEMTARYEVTIIRPQDGKAKRWDAYPDRERAESVAATLRQRGIIAQVCF